MKTTLLNSISTLLGILFTGIALINIFFGNDPFYGLFVLLLALLYYPFFSTQLKAKTNYTIPFWVKGLLALFILWTSLGVGELPAKIQMMLEYFK